MELRTYLKLTNIEKKEFAVMIGVSPSSISNYLSGKRMPPLEIGRKIEKVTRGRVTIDDLIEYWNQKNPVLGKKHDPNRSS